MTGHTGVLAAAVLFSLTAGLLVNDLVHGHLAFLMGKVALTAFLLCWFLVRLCGPATVTVTVDVEDGVHD